jgi:glycosyltransferase involved in cell wall biosynthesis
MLAGLPVVAAEAGGVPDAVLDGQTGRLVPPRNSAALVEAMIQSLNEAGQSRRMAESARRHAEEHFSARAMAEGTLAVYRKLLSR